jgi:hypothetical protein
LEQIGKIFGPAYRHMQEIVATSGVVQIEIVRQETKAGKKTYNERVSIKPPLEVTPGMGALAIVGLVESVGMVLACISCFAAIS